MAINRLFALQMHLKQALRQLLFSSNLISPMHLSHIISRSQATSWTPAQLELAAVLATLHHLSPFSETAEIKVLSDNLNVCALQKLALTTPRTRKLISLLTPWKIQLIKFIPTTENLLSDFLSRLFENDDAIPCEQFRFDANVD